MSLFSNSSGILWYSTKIKKKLLYKRRISMLWNIFHEIIKTVYSLQNKYKIEGMEYIPILYQHFPHLNKACKEKRTVIYEDKNQRRSKTKKYNTTVKKAVIRQANITDGKYYVCKVGNKTTKILTVPLLSMFLKILKPTLCMLIAKVKLNYWLSWSPQGC